MRTLPAVVRCALVLVASSITPLLQARQQPQPPAFKAQTLLVRLDVTVLDAEHRFVSGLSAEDFRVFEDDVPQRVGVFTFVNIPLAPLDGQPPRSAAHQAMTNVDAEKGRLVALILDDLNTRQDRADRVKEAARRVVARLQPERLRLGGSRERGSRRHARFHA
jgi:VWFA-related protein